MDSWEIKGRTLEYDPASHIYLVDGIIVSSVTQLLNKKFGHKYDEVSDFVLQQAADRGTMIHKAVEDYCNGLISEVPEVRDFVFLKNYYNFEIMESEIPVIIDLAGQTYAGRLDLIINIDGDLAVADIKTTAALDREYLGHQLNLYRLGAIQSYGFDIQKLYGIHLKNGKRKMVPIPVKEESWLVESLSIPEV